MLFISVWVCIHSNHKMSPISRTAPFYKKCNAWVYKSPQHHPTLEHNNILPATKFDQDNGTSIQIYIRGFTFLNMNTFGVN